MFVGMTCEWKYVVERTFLRNGKYGIARCKRVQGRSFSSVDILQKPKVGKAENKGENVVVRWS